MKYAQRWLQYLMHPGIMLLYFLCIGLAYVFLDKPWATSLHQLALGTQYPVLEWITQLGRTVMYLTLLPLLALCVRYSKRCHLASTQRASSARLARERSKKLEWRVWFLWLSVLATTAPTFLLKNGLGRARPELLFTQNIYGFFGWHLDSLYHSCPSGHAVLIATGLFSMTILMPRYRWLWAVLCGLIMLTRVVLTYHYLSDVLIAFYMVVIEYRIILYVIGRFFPSYWLKLGVQ